MTSIAIDRVDGLSSSTAIKGPCRVAAVAPLTLAGLQTIDGVTVAVNDRVLVTAQPGGAANGIYVVDTGPWRRAKDFSNNRDVRKGSQVFVTDGTLYSESGWYVASENPIQIDVDAIEIEQHAVLTAALLQAYVDAAAASALLAQQWAEAAAAMVIPAGSIVESKFAGALTLTLAKVCYSRAELKVVDTTRYNVAYLAEAGREGIFVWNGTDQSATMVRRSVTSITVDSAADTIAMRSATSSAVDSTTDIITANGHGFIADQEVTVTSTVNGLIAGGRYFVFNQTTNTFQLRTSLTAGAFNLTGTANVTVRARHELWTGNAVVSTASLDGLTLGTIYYVIRTNESVLQLASSYANARAGTAFNLTGTGALTLKHLADPTEALFVAKTASTLDGASGAWVRKDAGIINTKHCGGTGDGVTDDGHALQASVWLGAWLRRPTYTPAGRYMTSTPIKYETNTWINSPNQETPFGLMESPDNGIVWYGDGMEQTIIWANASFPNSAYMVSLDGNPNAVAQIVGSRPMEQGKHLWKGMQLRGRNRTVGTDVKAVFVRGVWAQLWDGIDFREFSGDMVTVGSGAPAGPPNFDEVDNTAQWVIEGCRFLQGGKSALVMYAVRIAKFALRNTEIRNMTNWGVNGCLAYSDIQDNVISGCGNRADATTGGIRFTDSVSGSECRTAHITGNVFENNFNFDIDILQCRGYHIDGNSFHTFLQTGGVITGKASVKLRNGGTGKNICGQIDGANRWPDYSAPSDGSKYDVPNISVEAGVTGLTIMNNFSDGSNTHIAAASPVDLHLINIPASYTVTLTGTAPVTSFQNYAAL